ncbi:hypothetical protein HK104_008105, partial [Borealophlyctis nickersoniae]
MAGDLKDALNYGVFMPGRDGKQGKFLEEWAGVGGCKLENNTQLEFIPKQRILPSSSSDGDTASIAGGTSTGPPSPGLNSKKKQKQLMEAVQKGNYEKVRERGMKGADPNFWTEVLETPLSAAVMNNDKEMISILVESGALLDYRVGDLWKTPLHLAAQHNKATALQTLIGFGAWVNCPDGANLTPLYYAVAGGHVECVMRLLSAQADTEIFDDAGKG